LLGILDKAVLTLGDNRRVDFSQCIIIMTSNLGACEMSSLVEGKIGFGAKPNVLDADFDEKINRTAVEAARRKFTPEFMNRIDKVVVFKTLRPEDLQQILEIELGTVQQRILMAPGTRKFAFHCTRNVKDFLLKEGTDAKYGARHLKRAIEKNLVFPLANLVSTSQVKLGDFVRIDLNSRGCMTFVKDEEGAPDLGLIERFQWAAGMTRVAAQSAPNSATPALLHWPV
jgi:ATP-dependent Clp protease ATP-binding subunit ClpB